MALTLVAHSNNLEVWVKQLLQIQVTKQAWMTSLSHCPVTAMSLHDVSSTSTQAGCMSLNCHGIDLELLSLLQDLSKRDFANRQSWSLAGKCNSSATKFQNASPALQLRQAHVSNSHVIWLWTAAESIWAETALHMNSLELDWCVQMNVIRSHDVSPALQQRQGVFSTSTEAERTSKNSMTSIWSYVKFSGGMKHLLHVLDFHDVDLELCQVLSILEAKSIQAGALQIDRIIARLASLNEWHHIPWRVFSISREAGCMLWSFMAWSWVCVKQSPDYRVKKFGILTGKSGKMASDSMMCLQHFKRGRAHVIDFMALIWACLRQVQKHLSKKNSASQLFASSCKVWLAGQVQCHHDQLHLPKAPAQLEHTWPMAVSLVSYKWQKLLRTVLACYSNCSQDK